MGSRVDHFFNDKWITFIAVGTHVFAHSLLARTRNALNTGGRKRGDCCGGGGSVPHAVRDAHPSRRVIQGVALKSAVALWERN